MEAHMESSTITPAETRSFVVPVYEGLSRDLLVEYLARYSRSTGGPYALSQYLASEYEDDNSTSLSIAELARGMRTGTATVRRRRDALCASGEWIAQSQYLASGYRLPNRYFPVLHSEYLPAGVRLIGWAIPVVQETGESRFEFLNNGAGTSDLVTVTP